MEERSVAYEQWYEGKIRIPSGCAVAGFLSKAGKRVSGRTIAEMMTVMHDRSNGLGAGYAVYGLYPEYRQAYAFHLILADGRTWAEVEKILRQNFKICEQQEIPVRRTGRYKKAPLLWCYFCEPLRLDREKDSDELLLATVMGINRLAPRASVMSCGQDLGVFKGVGYPEEIAEFYRLDQYRGYSWIGHGRFPTNTPGWWGGAHPFSIGEIAVVHNGELSSYGTNKSVLENYGYELSLRTDTEVMAYAIHYLRRQNLSWSMVAKVLAPPYWAEVERMTALERELYTVLRRTYGGLLMNGPFSIIVGFPGGLMALNDRLKLRSLVAGVSGADLYVASEEAAIRQVCPRPEEVWPLPAGEALICRAGEASACHVA